MNPTDYPNKNIDVDNALLKHTLFLIDQLLQLQPHEILVMDNEGNFPKQDNPLIKVIPSYQTYDFTKERPDWLNKINIDDYYEETENVYILPKKIRIILYFELKKYLKPYFDEIDNQINILDDIPLISRVVRGRVGERCALQREKRSSAECE